MRIDDTQKLVDVRNADLRNKQIGLEDTERELSKIREQNARMNSDIIVLRRENERVAAENFDLREEINFSEGRNADVSIQIRDTEIRIKEKEDALFLSRREVESLRISSA